MKSFPFSWECLCRLYMLSQIFLEWDRKYYSQDTEPLASELLELSIPRTFPVCGNTRIESVMTYWSDIWPLKCHSPLFYWLHQPRLNVLGTLAFCMRISSKRLFIFACRGHESEYIFGIIASFCMSPVDWAIRTKQY